MPVIAVIGILVMVVLEAVEQTGFTLGSRLKKKKWIYWGIGAAAHVAAIGIWYPILTMIPLGVAIPMTGLCYVSTTIAAKMVLGETISRRRWTAIFAVCFGVLLVYLGGGVE